MSVADIVRFRCEPDAAFEGNRHLVESAPTATVCLDLRQSLDKILSGMDARACRQRIRRAEKLGDRLKVETNPSGASSTFVSLYNEFARRKGRGVPRLALETLQRFVSVSDVWMLYFDGRLICGHVVLRDDAAKRVILMFSVNRRLEGGELAALSGVLNRYLHWQELKKYHSEGVHVYDFGGIGHENPHAAGYNQFKTSFGGAIVSERSYTFARMGRVVKIAIHSYKRLRARGVFGLM